jgi:hypothetical protein
MSAETVKRERHRPIFLTLPGGQSQMETFQRPELKLRAAALWLPAAFEFGFLRRVF